MEQLDHLITRKIRSTYGRRVFSPIIYCIFLIIVWFTTPVRSLMHPMTISDQAQIAALAADGTRFISTTLHNLNFEAVSALCADPDYKTRVTFLANTKEPTLRLKLSSGVDSLRQSKVFIDRYRACITH